jgi:hypothetical protein
LSRQDAVRELQALPNPLADFGKKKEPVVIDGFEIEEVD